MLKMIRVILLAVVLVALPGCGGGPSPSKGGTPGKLTFGSNVSSDIKVTIHRDAASGFEELGFANNSGATEPLWLEPGDYAFTLESIGPPVEFPGEFVKPESTPLKVTWTSDMTSISLEAPPELLTE